MFSAYRSTKVFVVMVVGGLLLAGCGPQSKYEVEPVQPESAKPVETPEPTAVETVPAPEPVSEPEAEPAAEPPAPTAVEWRGTGQTILHNSGFEEESTRPFAWWIEDQNPDGVVVNVETEAPFEGERAVKVELPADVTAGIYQTVESLEPGKSYWVCGHVKCEDYAGVARLEVHDARGYEVFSAGTSGVTGTQDWTQVAAAFTVPEDTEKVLVILRGQKDPEGASEKGTIWFDQVRLYHLKDSDNSAE